MSTAAKKTNAEFVRQNLIDELAEKGVYTIKGVSVEVASYEDLKQELALLPYRQINVDSPENKFF